MTARALIASLAIATCTPALCAQVSPGPQDAAPVLPIPAPRDRSYPGQIQLSVDASDVQRRIEHVHEVLTGVWPGEILLYPQWLPGTHAPEGTIDRLAGLRIRANGASVRWMRDPADVFAFRLQLPPRTSSLQIDFDYLSPTNAAVGDQQISPEVLMLEWNSLVLYPAGYFSRRIPIQADLTLPQGWQFASALNVAHGEGAHISFASTDLETFIDSPLYAGRYSSRLDLDPGASVPVHLNLFADRPDLLEVSAMQLQDYRQLVQQASRLFGSRHYAHYDFLYSLSNQVLENGLEHQQSSEVGGPPEAFTEWDRDAVDRDLLAHEYVHSWNGKFRRPWDLWIPNFNVPMQDSLLWVYEGQTEYWGHVLAARAGLRTRAQTLDELAMLAAYQQAQPARHWRSLQDTTNDEIINPRRPMSWSTWQSFESYYEGGALLWMDADTLIRERSGGARSLDDFARHFFGVDDGSVVTRTYRFEDVVQALNAVQPYDWAGFLRERLDSQDAPALLNGIRRGGYRLVFTATQSDYERNTDAVYHRLDLFYSLGLRLDDHDEPGDVSQVLWESPAFHAGLTNGDRIIAVNGTAYSGALLTEAVRNAATGSIPIQLIVKNADSYRIVAIPYYGGLRYPHLERDTSQPALLDAILSPR